MSDFDLRTPPSYLRVVGPSGIPPWRCEVCYCGMDYGSVFRWTRKGVLRAGKRKMRRIEKRSRANRNAEFHEWPDTPRPNTGQEDSSR